MKIFHLQFFISFVPVNGQSSGGIFLVIKHRFGIVIYILLIEGHAVLQLGDVYLDNIFGTTTTKEAMEERGYVFKQPAFLWFLPTTVAIKLLLGKIWKTKSRFAE